MSDDLLGITPYAAALLVHARYMPERRALWTDAEVECWERLEPRLQAHAKLVIPPMGKDKVWYGLTMRLVNNGTAHNQCETIVRAGSRAEAGRLLKAAGQWVHDNDMRDYWSVTGNREKLALATERGVWAKGSDGWAKVGLK